MKKSKLSSRILCSILALVMMLGSCTTVFAAESEETIKYVSLGDSMTNGYGLPGYNGNTGVEDYGEESYANKFAEWLARDGAEVEHAQLAMSAMRAEDLHWLLELDYENDALIDITDGPWNEATWNAAFSTGDYWTWNELCDDYRFAVAATYIKAKQGDQAAIDALYGDPDDPEDDNPTAKITNDEAKIVAEYYQEAVKNADIISLGMGNGNFGVFAFGRILEAIGFSGSPEDTLIYNVENAIRECEPEMQVKILELKGTLIEKLNAFKSENEIPFEEENWNALVNTAVYVALSYVLNYAGSVEAILQLNPDAEIILVALMNTFAEPGAEVDYTNISSIGDIMGAIFDPLNMFIAGLPAFMQTVNNGVYKNATFYYAEAPEVECLVNKFENEITEYPTGLIRDRFVESIVGSDNDDGRGMVWGILDEANVVGGIVPGATIKYVTLDDICAYEEDKAGFAMINSEKAISCALYLAFEDAILASIDSASVSLESVMGLGGLSFEIFAGVMEEFMRNFPVASAACQEEVVADLLEVAAPALADGINGALGFDVVDPEMALELLTAQDQNAAVSTLVAGIMNADSDVIEIINNFHNGGTVSDVIGCEIQDPYHIGYCGGVKTQFNNYVNDLNGAVTYAKGQALTQENIESLCMLYALPSSLSQAMQNDTEISGLLALFARCIIGNGLGGHPSAGGHESLAEAVITAYSEGYTALDETIKNLKDLIKEYYDEAYAYAYAEADKAGYIDKAAMAIDKAIEVITKLDLSETEITEEFKAELEKELVSLVMTLNEIKAALIEDKASDVNGLYNTAVALWDDLNTHLTNAGAILAQAEFDVKTLLCPVIDAYVKTIIEEYVMPFVDEIGDNLSDITLKKIDHKHYEAKEDSYYVAIGGDTVSGTNLDYEDKRYQQLIKEEYAIQYKKIAKEQLLSNEVLTLIAENAAEIKKADLITYQLDATNFIWSTLNVDADWDKYINEFLTPEERELVEKIVDETIRVLTMDWKDHADTKITELVGKIKEAVLTKLPEDVPFVEDIFDALVDFLLPYIQNEIIKIEEKVNEELELDEKIEEINNKITSLDETTKEYIEKFAFSFVAYAIETSKAVEAIQTINPDATLVVVGMYNPFRGLEIKFEENVINAEEYFEYVIDATNHYYSLLSMINKGFAFVDIAKAQTEGFNITIDVANIEELKGELISMALRLPEMMNANAAGHEYIATEVIKALICDFSEDWEEFDAENHAKVCSICGYAKTEAHSLSEDWEEADRENHSKECSVCGYVKTEAHSFGDWKSVSNSKHSKECSVCESVVTEAHNFVDGKCTECGKKKTTGGFSGGGGGGTAATTPKMNFKDVAKGEWFHDYVKTLFEKGLMNGISETEFAPNMTLTRGMFVTILHRVEGEPKLNAGNNFSDVNATEYYAKAVNWAVSKGIVLGISETEFAPNQEVTREQMAAMIARYVAFKKIKVADKEVTYVDSGDIADYAKEAVNVARNLEILIGNADGTFAPKKDATRAEAAALFVRLLSVLK